MHSSLRGRELAFAALLLGMLVAQLEGTIVVAALPAIGADYLDHLADVVLRALKGASS